MKIVFQTPRNVTAAEDKRAREIATEIAALFASKHSDASFMVIHAALALVASMAIMGEIKSSPVGEQDRRIDAYASLYDANISNAARAIRTGLDKQEKKQ